MTDNSSTDIPPDQAVEPTQDTSLLSRRRLLRAMGVSSAGVAAAAAIAASREKITEASDSAKEEIAELKTTISELTEMIKGQTAPHAAPPMMRTKRFSIGTPPRKGPLFPSPPHNATTGVANTSCDNGRG